MDTQAQAHTELLEKGPQKLIKKEPLQVIASDPPKSTDKEAGSNPDKSQKMEMEIDPPLITSNAT